MARLARAQSAPMYTAPPSPWRTSGLSAVGRITLPEAAAEVVMSPSARSHHETGSPSPDLMSAVTPSGPYAPPLASNEALTRALRAAFGSGRDSLAAWSS